VALYRMDRFARRHKASVAFGGALVALVVGFSVVTALQARRIARERDRAELEAAKATSINTFLQDVLGSADPWERGRSRDDGDPGSRSVGRQDW